jgi:acyl carrier protein
MLETTQQTLEQVFRAVLELPDGADVTAVRQVSQPSWDSLAHVSLVLAVESEFGLSIEIADSIELTSYDAFALFLEEKGL